MHTYVGRIDKGAAFINSSLDDFVALCVTDLIPIEGAETLDTLIRKIMARTWLRLTIAPKPNAATGV